MCMLNANTVNLNTHLPYISYYEYVFLLELLRELRDQILSLDVPSRSLSQESLRATESSFTISATRISGMVEAVSNTLVALPKHTYSNAPRQSSTARRQWWPLISCLEKTAMDWMLSWVIT
jgi:hypothetical protein